MSDTHEPAGNLLRQLAKAEQTAVDLGQLLRLEKAETDRLRAELAQARKDAARLRRGLRFYADGAHFHRDNPKSDTWDTVSGEPESIWCDDYGTTVEDGTLAKYVLDGWDIPDDPDDDLIPPATERKP